MKSCLGTCFQDGLEIKDVFRKLTDNNNVSTIANIFVLGINNNIMLYLISFKYVYLCFSQSLITKSQLLTSKVWDGFLLFWFWHIGLCWFNKFYRNLRGTILVKTIFYLSMIWFSKMLTNCKFSNFKQCSIQITNNFKLCFKIFQKITFKKFFLSNNIIFFK